MAMPNQNNWVERIKRHPIYASIASLLAIAFLLDRCFDSFIIKYIFDLLVTASPGIFSFIVKPVSIPQICLAFSLVIVLGLVYFAVLERKKKQTSGKGYHKWNELLFPYEWSAPQKNIKVFDPQCPKCRYEVATSDYQCTFEWRCPNCVLLPENEFRGFRYGVSERIRDIVTKQIAANLRKKGLFP